MTKNWSLSTLIIIAALAVSTTIDAQKMRPAEPEIAGKAWILVDAATGTVILERNADLHLPPASLAKMMTTYLCLLYTSPSPRDGLLSRMPSSA